MTRASLGGIKMTLAVVDQKPLLFILARARRTLRSFACAFLLGGHELYRAHSDDKMYQRCVLCGHETKGWTIDRRDRRLHLIKGRKAS